MSRYREKVRGEVSLVVVRDGEGGEEGENSERPRETRENSNEDEKEVHADECP